jgi:hypothetical protein
MARNKSDEEFEEAKADAKAEDGYTYAPCADWRANKLKWANQLVDELRDIVYGMAKDGASKGDISQFFGISTENFNKEFDEVYEMGRADLRLRIARRTVWLAFKSKMPAAAIWAGKVYCGYNEITPVADTQSSSGVTFNLTLAKKPDDVIATEADLEAYSAEYH